MVADPQSFESYSPGLTPEAIPEVKLKDALAVVNNWQWADVKIVPQDGADFYFEVSERTRELIGDLLDMFDDGQPAGDPCLRLVAHEYPVAPYKPEVVVFMTDHVKELTDYFPPASVPSLPVKRLIGEHIAQQEPIIQSFSEFLLEIDEAYQQFTDDSSRESMPDELVRFFEDLESNYKY